MELTNRLAAEAAERMDKADNRVKRKLLKEEQKYEHVSTVFKFEVG